MALTVAELLDLPVLAPARPEIVVGGPADLARPVRWVHTSEIYEISPLLKGGEVLLTTGLGLVGATAPAVRNYVASLAGIGVTAVFLELGRTFTAAPPALVDAARDERLPLVVLHGVVPFIEVTEVAHARIVGAEIEQLRAGAELADRLVAGMLDGSGLPGLVGRLADLAGCAVAVVAVGGELLAGTATIDPATAVTVVPLVVGGTSWGLLAFDGPLAEARAALVERAVPLLALEIQRSSPTLRTREQAGADLLGDIVNGRYASAGEIATRAAGVGLVVGPGQRAVALCLLVAGGGAARTTATMAAARTAARRTFGATLVAPLDEGAGVMVATAVRPRDLRSALGSFAAAVRTELELTTGGRFVVSAGPLVDDLAGLARSAPAARETAQLARRLTPAAEVVLADDFALYQLLAGLVDDSVLERFVREQLGALIDHDARTGAELVRTLDTYLSCGLSKAAAAGALGIRRQTLYGRLERIAALLGGLALDHRERRTALDLALVSWRLRTSAAGR